MFNRKNQSTMENTEKQIEQITEIFQEQMSRALGGKAQLLIFYDVKGFERTAGCTLLCDDLSKLLTSITLTMMKQNDIKKMMECCLEALKDNL